MEMNLKYFIAFVAGNKGFENYTKTENSDKVKDAGQIKLLSTYLSNFVTLRKLLVAIIVGILFFPIVPLKAQGPAKSFDKFIPGMGIGLKEIVVQTTKGDVIIGKGGFGVFTFHLRRVSNTGIIKFNKSYSGKDYSATSTILATQDDGYLLGSVVNDAVGRYYQMIKLNDNGILQWKKKYGLPSASGNIFLPVIQTLDGGFIMGGHTSVGKAGDKTEEIKDICPDWDTDPNSCGPNNEYWILKVNKDGNKLWDRSFGGGAEDNLRIMIPSTDGGCLLVGNSFSPQSANKTAPHLGVDDIWLVKVNSNGSKQWEKSLGGSDQDAPSVAIQTSDGGFLIRGSSFSETHGEKKTSIDKGSSWLVKVDKDGKYLWDKFPNWPISFEVNEIILPTKNSGFLVGLSSDKGIGGIKTEDCRGGTDYWMIKYGSTGTKLWDKRFGGNVEDKLLSLLEFPDGSYQLFGYSKSGIGGDKSVAEQKGWLVKTHTSLFNFGGKAAASRSTEPQLSEVEITSEESANIEGPWLYPNLVKNTINLHLPFSGTKEITVYLHDLNGNLFNTFRVMLSGSVNQLNVSGLPSGVYLLKVPDQYSFKSLRFVKE